MEASNIILGIGMVVGISALIWYFSKPAPEKNLSLIGTNVV